MTRAEYLLSRLREMRGQAGAALFSECGRYRYWLGRRWDFVSPPRVAVFVLHNPSKAGAVKNDPTTSKCVGFAKRWGCTGCEIVNQRCWIATDPSELEEQETREPRSTFPDPDYLSFIIAAVRGERRSVAYVIPAWGDSKLNIYPTPAHFSYPAGEIGRGAQIRCLGVTKNGTPRHPSRLPYSTELVPWVAA